MLFCNRQSICGHASALESRRGPAGESALVARSTLSAVLGIIAAAIDKLDDAPATKGGDARRDEEVKAIFS